MGCCQSKKSTQTDENALHKALQKAQSNNNDSSQKLKERINNSQSIDVGPGLGDTTNEESKILKRKLPGKGARRP